MTVASPPRPCPSPYRAKDMDEAVMPPSSVATFLMQSVATDDGGITASSMSFAIPGVLAVAIDGAGPTPREVQSGRYPLKRPLILVTKDVPSGDVRAFLDFMLTKEAQAIVAKKFVAVK